MPNPGPDADTDELEAWLVRAAPQLSDGQIAQAVLAAYDTTGVANTPREWIQRGVDAGLIRLDGTAVRTTPKGRRVVAAYNDYRVCKHCTTGNACFIPRVRELVYSGQLPECPHQEGKKP